MSNATCEQSNLLKLEREVKILRSFMIGLIGKDKEGKYRSEFVKKILKAAKEKGEFAFNNKNSFLSRLK